MRIIAGKFRRRVLLSPKDAFTTRPIPDRVKESLFSLLRGNIEDARVVDCFAGTGSIGLEALSRGARECVFVERDKRAAGLLERNIEALQCGDQAAVLRGDALGPAVFTRIAAMGGADLIFLDPPYPLVNDSSPGGGWERCVTQIRRLADVLSPSGFVCVRTPWPFKHFDEPTDQDAEASQPEHGGSRRTPELRGAQRQGFKGGKKKGKGRHKEEHQWIGSEIDIEKIQRETRELERQDRLARGESDDDVLDEQLIDDRTSDEDFSESVLNEEEDTRRENSDGADNTIGVQHGKPKFHIVDLRIPGVLGPETHVYGSTAVHLYMRQPKP